MQYFNGAPWREYVEQKLKQIGVITFNPYNHPFINSVAENNDVQNHLKDLINENKYDELSAIVKRIRAEDLRCIDISDFIFAYINPKFITCGAWEEIFWANREVKPIFFVVEGGKAACPFWMYGVFSHKYIYSSIDDALQVIYDIDNGIKEIDSSRWRLLRKEFR